MRTIKLNIYDGLQGVQCFEHRRSLNVIDDADAKIGFVAWEAIAEFR
jgi:hypothetical protein